MIEVELNKQPQFQDDSESEHKVCEKRGETACYRRKAQKKNMFPVKSAGNHVTGEIILWKERGQNRKSNFRESMISFKKNRNLRSQPFNSKNGLQIFPWKATLFGSPRKILDIENCL